MPGKCQNSTAHKNCIQPHILVVDGNGPYGNAVVAKLRELDYCAKSVRSVDEFLDLHCKVRIDAVSLEVDAFDGNPLDELIKLRTHFGEGPNTTIALHHEFSPTWFIDQLLSGGADLHLKRHTDPSHLALNLRDIINGRTG